VVLLGDTLAARDAMLEKMHEESVRRDEYVDKEVDKHQERLARHRHDLEVLRGKVSRLEEANLLLTAQVESMSDKLCRCNEGRPGLVGRGTIEEPFELEYAGSPTSYHTPPSVPSENHTPIPVPSPTPSNQLPSSDQENEIPICCMIPTRCVHDEVADMLEDEIAAPRVITTRGDRVIRRPSPVRQTCRKSNTLRSRLNVPHPYQAARRRRDQVYHLGDSKRFRQQGRYFNLRAERGYRDSGYDSNDESGSSGLSSFDEDADHLPGPCPGGLGQRSSSPEL